VRAGPPHRPQFGLREYRPRSTCKACDAARLAANRAQKQAAAPVALAPVRTPVEVARAYARAEHLIATHADIVLDVLREVVW
jgi:hypothetical protein